MTATVQFYRSLALLGLHLSNSLDKLRHTRSVAYSVELVLQNKRQISGGAAYLDCYLDLWHSMLGFIFLCLFNVW